MSSMVGIQTIILILKLELYMSNNYKSHNKDPIMKLGSFGHN
jgi:hypothetical protein